MPKPWPERERVGALPRSPCYWPYAKNQVLQKSVGPLLSKKMVEALAAVRSGGDGCSRFTPSEEMQTLHARPCWSSTLPSVAFGPKNTGNRKPTEVDLKRPDKKHFKTQDKNTKKNDHEVVVGRSYLKQFVRPKTLSPARKKALSTTCVRSYLKIHSSLACLSAILFDTIFCPDIWHRGLLLTSKFQTSNDL